MRRNSVVITMSRLLLKAVFAVFVTVLFGTFAFSAVAVTNDTPKSPTRADSPNDDYKIGPDDVLTVSVTDAPEYGGKFRVTDSGVIELPGVSAPIQATGMSPSELAHNIRRALIDSKQLRDPRVSIFVDEYHGRTVTVLGAVAKPAVYSLQKRTTVLEALSLAGGTIPNAGNTVTIVRGVASAESSGTTVGSVQIITLSSLMNGTASPGNVEVKNGDVVSVSAAQLVYVVGSVIKPGGYTMADPSSGVSVVQAVAMAQGLNPVANRHAVIVRASTSENGRQEIPVDLDEMMKGKIADVALAPNDILYIPSSASKKTLRALGEIAIVAASGIAIYGVGYRAGGLP